MSSRKEEKERLRQERLEREQAAEAAERRRRLLGIVAGGVLAVAAAAAIVVAVVAGGGSGDPKPNVDDGPNVPIPRQQITQLDEAAKEAGCRVRTFAPGPNDRQHVNATVPYPQNPPVFGPHDPQPASDGNYAGQGDVPREQLVHSLEHGRVIVWYRAAIGKRRISQLETLFEEPFGGRPEGYHQILVQDDGIPTPLAASTWGQQMTCPRVTDATFDALRTFRARYVDKAPEQVP